MTDADDKAEQTGPGDVLRAARERQGMTRQEVADRLNLRACQIKQFEEDVLESELSPTFIRGYFKSYAKLLGLDQKDIIDRVERLGIKQSPPVEMHSFSKRTTRQRHDSRLKLVTTFIVLIIVFLVVAWWWQEYQTSHIAQNSMSTSVADDIMDVLSSEPSPSVGEQTTTHNDDAVPAVDANSDTLAPAADDTATATAADDNVSAEPPQAAADPAELVMNFSAQCWVRIKDAQGNTLAFGNQQAGRTLHLSGELPYSMILGAPEAVTMELNGIPVEMPSFRKGRALRLTIPAPTSQSPE